jgi:arginyl-tRNA synthetase
VAAAREATAAAIATGALRYFLLKFGRTKIITFDMDEALAFTGETGPYIQNGVVRARNIFAKLEAEGHAASTLVEKGRGLDLDRLLDGEEGDEVWSLLLHMARSEEVAEQALKSEEVALLAKHAFAVAQAFHAYYQKPRYSVLYAQSDELRAFRVLVVDAFLRHMDVLAGLLGIPVPERM